jgi:hypothetical protein
MAFADEFGRSFDQSDVQKIKRRDGERHRREDSAGALEVAKTLFAHRRGEQIGADSTSQHNELLSHVAGQLLYVTWRNLIDGETFATASAAPM